MDLSFYHPHELVGEPVDKVLAELLHIYTSPGCEESNPVYFLFRKDLEPVAVNIDILHDNSSGHTLYRFTVNAHLQDIINNPPSLNILSFSSLIFVFRRISLRFA